MFQSLIQSIKVEAYSLWDETKSWFHNRESIFIARVTAFGGFLVAALEGMDWSALLSLDFSNVVHNSQALIVGAGIFLHGVISEIARRRNDPSFQAPAPVQTPAA